MLSNYIRNALLVITIGSLPMLTGCAPAIVAGTVAGAGTAIVKDRRPMETIIEDNAIELRATDAIYSDEIIGKSVHVDVHSFNGIVLLTGEAPNTQMREHAGHVVYAMRNAREVYNEVRVVPKSPVDERANDSWLSRKVKLTIIADKGLFTHTKVVVANGVVYLMGLVTPDESRKIQSLVATVKGVKSIVPLFEPIDTSSEDILKASTAQVRESIATKPKAPSSDEDELTILPYTLQPPVQIDDGE